MGDRAVLECPATSRSVSTCDLLDYQLYYAVFFDGTGNNYFNTTQFTRIETSDDREALRDRGGSYLNDYSNVAKLWRAKSRGPSSDPLRISKKLYMDGIGTTRHQDDSTYGFISGDGDTGVEHRCSQALTRVRRELRRISSSADCGSIELTIDLFGFSRGAAAARHFVHRILRANFDNEKVETKNIRFLGLFDSVSAHGPIHRNDVAYLHLNRLDQAEKVIQYAAADEFRANFELTSIDSAINAGVGTQHYLPGAHSDVGGGYSNGLRETDMYLRYNFLIPFSYAELWDDKLHLINMGYYERDEFQQSRDNKKSMVTRSNSISNAYGRVPFHLMVEDVNSCSFDFLRFTNTRYSLTNEMEGVKYTLRQKMDNGPIELSEWGVNQRIGDLMLTELRRRYLHFSSRHLESFGAHAPRFSGNLREREVYPG